MGHYLSEMGGRSKPDYGAERRHNIACQTNREYFLEQSPFRKNDFKKGMIVKFRKGLDKETLKMYFSRNYTWCLQSSFRILNEWTDDKKCLHFSIVTTAGILMSTHLGFGGFSWYDYRWFEPASMYEKKKYFAELRRQKKLFENDFFAKNFSLNERHW